MTDWLHMKPLKPKQHARDDARHDAQSAFSSFLSRFLNSAMPSIIMLLPRETIRPSNPHECAPATADDSATRQATFENGNRTVNSQV